MTRVSPRGRRLLRWAFVAYVTFVAWRILPTAPFAILAVIVLLASAFVLAATWYERALDAETENVSLRVAVAGLEVDNAELVRENDSLLDRLGEVLDERALCPAPVDEVEFEKPPLAKGGIVKSGTVTIISEGRKVPAQRKGGKS